MPRKRAYVLRARGERLAETRQRIAHATMELHQEVGPRDTTISAIAERAGVERLTVYRHFPDEDSLFAACSARFLELNPPPDSAGWGSQADPLARATAALGALYRYFGNTRAMLEKLYRDAASMPPLARVMDPFESYLRGIADDLADAVAPGDRATRAVCHHAVQFSTWRSLADQGVADPDKVTLIAAWLRALVAARHT